MKSEPLFRGIVIAMSLLVSGCAHNANEAPPLDNGVYVAGVSCEGDCYRYWRASAPVAILARLDPASPVIATVAPDEWVEVVDGEYRFVPLRGVVHTATETPPLAVGDVVYMLEQYGEGTYELWHRGKTLLPPWDAGRDNEPITWDAARQAPLGVVLGWWVQLRLESGQTGWVELPSSFECMGSLQGSVDCRE